ncbi:MAG: hypothetical protein ACRED7_08905, partial [Stellaceae bacterium]
GSYFPDCHAVPVYWRWIPRRGFRFSVLAGSFSICAVGKIVHLMSAMMREEPKSNAENSNLSPFDEVDLLAAFGFKVDVRECAGWRWCDR